MKKLTPQEMNDELEAYWGKTAKGLDSQLERYMKERPRRGGADAAPAAAADAPPAAAGAE